MAQVVSSSPVFFWGGNPRIGALHNTLVIPHKILCMLYACMVYLENSLIHGIVSMVYLVYLPIGTHECVIFYG